MGSRIAARDLVREFYQGSRKIQALKGVSLEIDVPGLYILQGPSGSGKTTLINLLGALDTPSSGSVYFNDSPLHEIAETQRDRIRRYEMGFIFQSVALISLMSARENVEFALQIAGYPRNRISARAGECLKIVGLGKRMEHRPHELSGGEQQRVAIARAIAHGPGVIFADEPTAELDSGTGMQVIKLFQEIVADQGVTIVMSSHDPNIIELGERVFRFEDGLMRE